MNNKYDIIRRMIGRKRFCKRFLLMGVSFALSFYISLLLFGDLKSPVVMHLTNLNRCPACYGISLCPELYSNQIILERGTNHLSRLFNAKNIYYGFTKTNKRVVLKKLAHNWEFKKFDKDLCRKWKLSSDCKPNDLLNLSNVEDEIMRTVQYNFSWSDTEPRNGMVLCPYAHSIFDLIRPVLSQNSNKKSDLVNAWTMLTINPEPIFLQVLQKNRGWPVPAWAGVCGRLEVVAFEGDPLSSLTGAPWHLKLLYAQKILDAAMDFTFKHERFRFYLMDWSLDNIVANAKNEITFVDIEDVVVLDKFIMPGKDLPYWYQRYNREPMGSGFTFSIENMCKHHLSDHNLWAACYILAGDETPLLYPIPRDVNASRPHFDRLLYDCLNGNDRFQTVTKLQQVIGDMLGDLHSLGFGAVR